MDEKLGEMDQSVALKRAGSDADALSIIRSNRGKALMDEINVFLYGAMLDADEKSTLFEAEQQNNAAMLRWVSIVAAFVIVLVVAAVAFTVYRNRQEITQARDEVRAINLTLEERVETQDAGAGARPGTRRSPAVRSQSSRRQQSPARGGAGPHAVQDRYR